MKTIRSVFIAVMLVFTAVNGASAQEKSATLTIRTSATCDMCKKTIENYLAFEKGIRHSELDVSTKLLTVMYDPRRTTPDRIRLAVTKSGYDADDLKADPKAYNKLEECCRKGQVCTDVK